MDAVCQRCRRRERGWTVTQAEFNVGSVEHWKVRLCRTCTETVEKAVLDALEMPVQRTAPAEGGLK